MATFEYNALTSTGRLMKGSIEAASADQASEMLRQMDLTVNEIQKSHTRQPTTPIGRSEFLLFNQQLASITKAGVPLDRGLRELANDIGSRSMRKLVVEIADDLSAGISIEDAIKKRERHFPPLYGRILKAGVETGRLSEMLTSLNRHLEVGLQTKRIILEALTYPIIVMVLASVIITGVFLMIIPTFADVLADMTDGEQSLPWLTQLFFTMAKNIVPFWIGVFAFVGVLVVIYIALSSSPPGRRVKESILLRVPLMGRLYRSSILARVAEAMAMLVDAGCDMGQSLRLSAGASGSESMKLECNTLAGQLEQGTSIMEAGHVCCMIPRIFLYSVQLGYQRNELQDNLFGLGRMYSEQTRCVQSNLQAALIPGLIVILGLVVATLILAMFLPMTKIITVMM